MLLVQHDILCKKKQARTVFLQVFIFSWRIDASVNQCSYLSLFLSNMANILSCLFSRNNDTCNSDCIYSYYRKPGPYQPFCATQIQTAPSCTVQWRAKLCGSSPMFAEDPFCTCAFLGAAFCMSSLHALQNLSKLNAPTNKFSFDVPTKFWLCLFMCICLCGVAQIAVQIGCTMLSRAYLYAFKSCSTVRHGWYGPRNTSTARLFTLIRILHHSSRQFCWGNLLQICFNYSNNMTWWWSTDGARSSLVGLLIPITSIEWWLVYHFNSLTNSDVKGIDMVLILVGIERYDTYQMVSIRYRYHHDD